MPSIAAGHRPLVARADTSGTNHRMVDLDRRSRSSGYHMDHCVFERIAKARSCRELDDADPQVDMDNLSRSG